VRVHPRVSTRPERDDEGRDRTLDTLLGPGAQIRAGRPTEAGCILIGGVGLPWLRDLDFGTNWLARAAELDWPDGVLLEDLSYSAHRVLHRLQELEPQRVILIGCMPRDDEPGTVRRYRLGDLPPPDPTEVHERLTDAVGGIIDLDHTLAIGRHWGALRDDTVVIEVEPAEREFGWGFSEPVEGAVDEVLALVRAELAA
jgi:hydrogenase maturation protease